MNNPPALDPFQAPDSSGPPRPARLRIIEWHSGPRFKHDRPLIPNSVSVNGHQLYAPVEEPIVIEQISIDGTGARPLIVRLRLQARALSAGPQAEPLAVPAGGSVAGRSFSVIEIPGLGDSDEVPLAAPYAVVNGEKLLLAGDVLVDGPSKLGDSLFVVQLPLICRSLVVDDATRDA